MVKKEKDAVVSSPPVAEFSSLPSLEVDKSLPVVSTPESLSGRGGAQEGGASISTDTSDQATVKSVKLDTPLVVVTENPLYERKD